MAVTIKVSEEVWSELNKKKKPGKSFSDIIEEMLENQEKEE